MSDVDTTTTPPSNLDVLTFITGTGNWEPRAPSGAFVPTNPIYTITNDTPTRTVDADLTSLDEVADLVSTLIRDLVADGVLAS